VGAEYDKKGKIRVGGGGGGKQVGKRGKKYVKEFLGFGQTGLLEGLNLVEIAAFIMAASKESFW